MPCFFSNRDFGKSKIERVGKSPLVFPKEKTRGLNALNFVFDYLSQLRKDFGFALVHNALRDA